VNDCLLFKRFDRPGHIRPERISVSCRRAGCKHKSSFASKPLDSDGLDDSSEAEEESELCSVRKHSIDERVLCQTLPAAITTSVSIMPPQPSS
jgi:hypothetical protein